MTSLKEKQQREEFRNILLDLAKDQEYLKDAYNRSNMYKRLERLYDSDENNKNFRHYYSDIFQILIRIERNFNDGDLEILSQNLERIKNGYNPQNYSENDKRLIDISNSINKLYDHVNLDIARIMYYKGENSELPHPIKKCGFH